MSNLSQLTFTKPEKVNHIFPTGETLAVTSERKITSDHPVLYYSNRVLAIDPGKNFGVAVVGRGKPAMVINGVLSEIIPLREVAFTLSQVLCRQYSPDMLVLEGASYGDRYGQVKLAEIRAGFAIGATEVGVEVKIVAPKTPRKVVFGSGDTQAMDVWVALNHNAADALCLALYPYYAEKGRAYDEQVPQVVKRRSK